MSDYRIPMRALLIMLLTVLLTVLVPVAWVLAVVFLSVIVWHLGTSWWMLPMVLAAIAGELTLSYLGMVALKRWGD